MKTQHRVRIEELERKATVVTKNHGEAIFDLQKRVQYLEGVILNLAKPAPEEPWWTFLIPSFTSGLRSCIPSFLRGRPSARDPQISPPPPSSP